jgi:hypothetical protein
MRTFALTHTMPAAKPSVISTRAIGTAKQDGALEGVLIFTGISFTLAALAIVFHALSLPSAFLL